MRGWISEDLQDGRAHAAAARIMGGWWWMLWLGGRARGMRPAISEAFGRWRRGRAKEKRNTDRPRFEAGEIMGGTHACWEKVRPTYGRTHVGRRYDASNLRPTNLAFRSGGSSFQSSHVGVYDAVSFFEKIRLATFDRAAAKLESDITNEADYPEKGEVVLDIRAARGFIHAYRHVAVGRDTVYKMADDAGGPIGGPLSGTLSRVVLCADEHDECPFLAGAGDTWLTRYEDDVLVISRRCPACARARINSIYSHPFEEERANVRKNATGVDETTDEISVSWMDFELKLIPRGSGRWRLEMGELRNVVPSPNMRASDSRQHACVPSPNMRACVRRPPNMRASNLAFRSGSIGSSFESSQVATPTSIGGSARGARSEQEPRSEKKRKPRRGTPKIKKKSVEEETGGHHVQAQADLQGGYYPSSGLCPPSALCPPSGLCPPPGLSPPSGLSLCPPSGLSLCPPSDLCPPPGLSPSPGLCPSPALSLCPPPDLSPSPGLSPPPDLSPSPDVGHAACRLPSAARARVFRYPSTVLPPQQR